MIKMDIRDLMKWAYAEELPALERAPDSEALLSSYGAFEHLAKLGCFVDGSSTPADQLAATSVHPDALAVHEAVSYLAAEEIDLPEGWDGFADLDDPHGLIAGAAQEALARRAGRDRLSRASGLARMVIANAWLGKEPEWRMEQPRFRMAGRDGRPGWYVMQRMKGPRGTSYEMEVNGYDDKRQRPKPGAYRKWEFAEPFDAFVLDRIDWSLWALALEKLHRRLNGRLEAHDLTALSICVEPWRDAHTLARAA